MIYQVLFAGGAHGNFLTVLLNHALGIRCKQRGNSRVFDHFEFSQDLVFEIQQVRDLVVDPDRCVQIRVSDRDMLKWAVMTISRTTGHDRVIEDLHHDPWQMLADHPHMSPLLESLATISNQQHGAVRLGLMREWARLCFFANDCRTLREILQQSVIPDASLTVEFGDIYRAPMDVVLHVLTHFGLQIRNAQGLDDHIRSFETRNRYRLIDFDTDMILQCLDQRVNLKFDSGNFVKQAWIDNYLVTRYNIDPLLIDHYWTDTYQILEAYGL